jgi:epoxide hydrolase-like predicted phosphatase
MIHAVLFDIGGVLEATPDLGVTEFWEAKLGLAAGELDACLHDAWVDGSIGLITLAEVHRAVMDRLGLTEDQCEEFMDDVWHEYLGEANTELIQYVRGLRPRYRTGILSNSFVGAREHEQAAYGFEDLVDEIVYSHESGMIKPDPRIYALACERLGVRPEQAVLVDDSEDFVVGARQAGLQAIRFRDNAQSIADIGRLLVTG